MSNSSIETINQRLKQLVANAQTLEELERIVFDVLDNLEKNQKIAFVAGPISAKTKLGKIWNRYALHLRTQRIAKIIAKENMLAISASITPYHLEKLPVEKFYNMYDRISDTSHRLYVSGNWKKSKGAKGEYERAKKRNIDVFEVRERFLWIPIWFRKISLIKL